MDFKINKKKLQPPLNINVSSVKSPGTLLVTWDNVITEEKDIISIKYNVYRSISLGGIFYKVSEKPEVRNRYEDNSVGRNPNTQYFYKVSTIAEFEDGSITEGNLSNPIIFQIPTTNKWFKKVNERNMWILKNTGVLMDLYVRKTEGERCKSCFDSIRSSSDPDCLNCFGTTYEGGFEPMVSLYVRQKPATQNLEITSHGLIPNNNPGAWTISKISIRNRDLLINPQGQIFSVLSSQVSHAAGYLFHQELTMKELDPTDNRYKIKRHSLYPDI